MDEDRIAGRPDRPVTGRQIEAGPDREPSAPTTEWDAETLPVVEETVRVDKRDVVTGRIRVRTLTTSREEIAAADLSSETVEIERLPVGREIDAVPAVRTEGDVTIVPVVEEVLVVETRLVLKEEIHIRRTRSTERFETPVVLRRQDAAVDRLEPDDGKPNEET